MIFHGIKIKGNWFLYYNNRQKLDNSNGYMIDENIQYGVCHRWDDDVWKEEILKDYMKNGIEDDWITEEYYESSVMFNGYGKNIFEVIEEIQDYKDFLLLKEIIK